MVDPFQSPILARLARWKRETAERTMMNAQLEILIHRANAEMKAMPDVEEIIPGIRAEWDKFKQEHGLTS
jgi:hypothetical protein